MILGGVFCVGVGVWVGGVAMWLFQIGSGHV